MDLSRRDEDAVHFTFVKIFSKKKMTCTLISFFFFFFHLVFLFLY